MTGLGPGLQSSAARGAPRVRVCVCARARACVCVCVCVCVYACVGSFPWVPRWHPSAAYLEYNRGARRARRTGGEDDDEERLLARFGMSEYYGSEGFDRPPSDV
eukprot:scaffold57416_cov60-Phaeocystis_antarctica.AAC.4